MHIIMLKDLDFVCMDVQDK